MLALEVVPLAVTDIDRALAFYTEQAGFTLDVDYRPTSDFRVVQLTPPGSACSVQLVMADSPARVHNLYLVTPDLAAARAIDQSRRRGRCDPAQGPGSKRGPADGARGWTPSVATMPASPTSRTQTATPGPCKNAITRPHE
jgi:hypothetical protein